MYVLSVRQVRSGSGQHGPTALIDQPSLAIAHRGNIVCDKTIKIAQAPCGEPQEPFAKQRRMIVVMTDTGRPLKL
jgi:hypothetical protein